MNVERDIIAIEIYYETKYDVRYDGLKMGNFERMRGYKKTNRLYSYFLCKENSNIYLYNEQAERKPFFFRKQMIEQVV